MSANVKFATLSNLFDDPRLVRVAVLVGIPILAFALRAAWLVQGGADWALGGDAGQYIALSSGLLHGCGFAYWLHGSCGTPDAFRTPVYPALLTIFHGSWRIAVASQALLGALVSAAAAGFLYLRFAPRTAAFAALVIALDVPSIFATKFLMADDLCQLLLTIGVILCVSAFYPMPQENHRTLKVAAGGSLMGLAALTRPAAASALPILVLPFLLSTRVSFWRELRLASLGVVISGGLLGIWILRNYRIYGLWTLSTTGSLNLSIGANALLSDTVPDPPAKDASILGSILPTRPLSLIPGRPVTTCPGTGGTNELYDSTLCQLVADPTVSRQLLEQATAAIWHAPLRTVLLAMEGLLRVGFLPHVPGTPDVELSQRDRAVETGNRSPMMRIIVYIVVAFQVAILLLAYTGVGKAVLQGIAEGCKSRHALLIWLFTGTGLLLLMAPALLFSWQTRYRCLAIPFIAIVAAIGWFPGCDREAPSSWQTRNA